VSRGRKLAVDQELDVVAGARRWPAVGPQARREHECSPPPRPHKPAPVVRANERLDPVADDRIGAPEQIRIHTASLPNRPDP
jgi:hypothetical protein